MAAKKEVEYRFLLVGKSGSGKSSTANSIMGENVFPVGTGLASCTKFCEVRKSSKPKKGVTFRIVDTPGLFDPKKSNEEIKEEIIKATAYLHPGFHAILYVLKIDRYTPEERETFNHLKSLFDPNVVKHVIIIFTRGDELKKKNMSLETLLNAADEPFKEVLRECGNRVLVFNNEKPDPKNIQELLGIVDQIWKDNGEAQYTCPLQNHVNVNLERTVTMRTQEQIERDPKLKQVFKAMSESVRKAMQEVKDQDKLVEDSTYTKEMKEKMLAENEKKEQEMKERQEEERRAEAEREHKRREQEKEELRKEVEQLKKDLEVAQKVKEEKEKIQEKSEKKLAEETQKLEKEEMEKTKDAIAQDREKHWILGVIRGAADVAGVAWRATKAWFGF